MNKHRQTNGLTTTNQLSGLSYDPMNDADEWVDFSFDIGNKLLTGGSYNRYETL